MRISALIYFVHSCASGYVRAITYDTRLFDHVVSDVGDELSTVTSR